MLPIPLDRASELPLQEQIYRYIRDRIGDGTLCAGVRLPATRVLAEGLKVSRNTALFAYDRLVSEGYLTMRPGQGAFVAEIVKAEPLAAFDFPEADEDERVAGTRPVHEPPIITAGHSRPAFDFWYARTDPRLFPARIWRSLAWDVLGGCAAGLSEYGPICGDPDLRQAIATHLAETRAINASPGQIIVTTGAQEALNLIARLFLEPGAVAVVEDPGYAAAAQVFETHGGQLVSCAVDDHGLALPELPRDVRPAFVFVTPSHQFPAGAVMSLDRRRDLIGACERHGGLIIEDDYDSDIFYENPPLAAIAAIDGLRRTVYVGSFSKSLGSGLRLGYVVMPQRYIGQAQAVKSLMSYGQSWLDQQILARFMASGRFSRHLRKLRVAYQARRDAMIAGLRTWFGEDAAIKGTETGLYLTCAVPHGVDLDRLCALAAKRGIGLYGAAACGVRAKADDAARFLVLGYAGLTPNEIARAFRLGSGLADRAGASV